MSRDHALQVGFVYVDDAHREPTLERANAGVGSREGLYGRHVANSEFLDAWLTSGDWERLVAVVPNQESANSLAVRFAEHPRVKGSQQKLALVPLQRFHERFLSSPTEVLHLPQPVDTEFAWVRHHKARHAFSLSGVTHTISLKEVMDRLRDLVTGPFEAYDTLFCISKAALSVVRAVTDNYAAFLRERHGGDPRLRLRLEHVPFGVDTDRFRPATPEERSQARVELGVAPDAICVLFVGRLSYASKVHPFPMYRATSEAARRSGRKVHLLLAGWAEAPSILQKFQQGASLLAPGVTTTFVDGMHPRARAQVWKAADVFTSLSDNIQETLGLTILEAQACGLPVVTSDWDGCRESIAPGESGFTITTRMVQGATEDGTSRHLMAETSPGAFLGETNQAVAVDTFEATEAFSRLFADPTLRASMGAAGRKRVIDEYGWPRVVRRYQDVWKEQETVRREHAARAEDSSVRTPVVFPDVEYSFAAYPSAVLDMPATVTAAGDAAERLDVLLKLPIANYVASARITESNVLASVLRAARTPCALAELDSILSPHATHRQQRRATLAWLLKYDLLRVTA